MTHTKYTHRTTTADGWTVAVTVARPAAGKPWGLVEMCCRPGEPSVTGREMRALPFGQLLAAAKSAAANEQTPPNDQSIGAKPSIAQPSDFALKGFEEPGKHRSDRDYAELALEYVMRVHAGDRNVAASIAQKFGGNPRTWTMRISEARKRGLLTHPSKRGEVGGEITDDALRLLGSNGDEA